MGADAVEHVTTMQFGAVTTNIAHNHERPCIDYFSTFAFATPASCMPAPLPGSKPASADPTNVPSLQSLGETSI